MIIWSRWGILAFIFGALGLAAGFAVAKAVSPDAGTVGSGAGLIVGAAALWAFNRFVIERYFDKATPVMVEQAVTEPAMQTGGAVPAGQPVQTTRLVEARDAQGRPIVRRPRSTFFFIPLGIWPFIIAAIGVVMLVFGFGRL